uniref:Uncharacterized protein n=1 Tax=Picea glauca TaxID=3330 RepID=A0A101M1J8_PICGL|nr:hypothetical protein ABT39_MTgene3895 [Picea glauca]
MKEICNSDFHDPSLNERDHSGMNYICNYAISIDRFCSFLPTNTNKGELLLYT